MFQETIMPQKLILLFCLLLPGFLMADETPVMQRTGKTFDASIPTIQAVLGYDFGDQITHHSGMERYLNELAGASPRIKLQQIGSTYEGRALYYVIVSSPENMKRLDELRQANLQLADPRSITPSQADAIIDTHPVFVCLSYSVHGNEHSGVEAALALIYYLAASNDTEMEELLKNLVILIDPMQNPDGRERFIQYFTSMSGKSPNPDLNAAEHNEVWPGGRTNHYLFDMNRDWVVMSQIETQARIAAYRQYQPEVFIDLHEMGENSTYFFPPPAEPRNPNVPESLSKWWNVLGKAVASEFDRRQVEYFTQERFDFWYPGYGDSWPTYNGAVSGTFEQGSVRGLVVRREDKVVVDYKDAVWHHFLASLATCRMASANRNAKLRDFYDFRASAVQEGKTGPVKEFLLRRSSDPLQTDRVVQLLLLHGIEVRRADADFRVTAHGYMDDRMDPSSYQRGDYIIAMDQPLKRLIQVIFERESRFDPSFLKEEEKRRREKEPTELYDITAWSLPLALGVDAAWSTEVATVPTSPVTAGPVAAQPLAPSTYAYLLNYRTNEDIVVVQELLERGVRLYFSSKPFTRDGIHYAAGSFIIRVKDNPQSLPQILGEVSQQTGVAFAATSTGWTEEGPDLGSNDVEFLETPHTAVLTGTPTDPNSYGAISYLLDRRYNIPYTALNTMDFSDIEIKDYNVLILPDSGSYDLDYKKLLDQDALTRLKAWVENGGTLIAIGGGANFLINDGTLTGVKRISRFLKDSAEPAPEKEDKKTEASGKEPETESPDTVPGSVARAALYRKSMLSFGYTQDEIPVIVNSSNLFDTPPDLKAAVSYAEADRLKVAGLFWDITKKRMEHKAYATVEDAGYGHVILFAEDPNFRAAWEGLNRLFLNGILFGPSL